MCSRPPTATMPATIAWSVSPKCALRRRMSTRWMKPMTRWIILRESSRAISKRMPLSAIALFSERLVGFVVDPAYQAELHAVVHELQRVAHAAIDDVHGLGLLDEAWLHDVGAARLLDDHAALEQELELAPYRFARDAGRLRDRH